MIRIWLNHWFSTAYSIIQLIKKDESDFRIIGSNERENTVYKKVCDEWHIEPVLKEEEYVSYCLDFCVKNRVDVFVPRRKLVAISRNKERYEKTGVKVLVDDYELVRMLNHKDEISLLNENLYKDITLPVYQKDTACLTHMLSLLILQIVSANIFALKSSCT